MILAHFSCIHQFQPYHTWNQGLMAMPLCLCCELNKSLQITTAFLLLETIDIVVLHNWVHYTLIYWYQMTNCFCDDSCIQNLKLFSDFSSVNKILAKFLFSCFVFKMAWRSTERGGEFTYKPWLEGMCRWRCGVTVNLVSLLEHSLHSCSVHGGCIIMLQLYMKWHQY